jgi:hypothetical protein
MMFVGGAAKSKITHHERLMTGWTGWSKGIQIWAVWTAVGKNPEEHA